MEATAVLLITAKRQTPETAKVHVVIFVVVTAIDEPS